MNTYQRQEIAKRIENSLDVIGILGEALVENGAHKADDEVQPPITDRQESGIHSAIIIIARMAHRDFCDLATDMEIPQ